MLEKKKQNNIILLFVGLLVCFFAELVFIASDVVYGTAENEHFMYAGANILFIALIVIFIGLILCYIATLKLRKYSRKLRNSCFIFFVGAAACLFQFLNTFFFGMVFGGGIDNSIEYIPMFTYTWFEGVDVVLCVSIVLGFVLALYGFVDMASDKKDIKAFKKVDKTIILFAIAYTVGEFFEITVLANINDVSMAVGHTLSSAAFCAAGMLVAYISLVVWFIGFLKEILGKNETSK